MAEVDIPLNDCSINTDAVTLGTYKLIRWNGDESIHQGPPNIRNIQRLIGCTGLDQVTIDKKRQIVMFVDDTGMIDSKPVNPKATELYHRVCKSGTLWAIHGDVVIVPAGGLR